MDRSGETRRQERNDAGAVVSRRVWMLSPPTAAARKGLQVWRDGFVVAKTVCALARLHVGCCPSTWNLEISEFWPQAETASLRPETHLMVPEHPFVTPLTMAANVIRQGAKATPVPLPDLRQDAWDEEKLETALQRLKELHIKVRMTLPPACFL